MINRYSANGAWLETLKLILCEGQAVKPRGRETLEVPQHTVRVDMNYPVVTHKLRRLNYRFMAAEAFWILTGDDRVETVAPYNPNISQFSDDGVTFAGAYGPRIMAQLGWVVAKLREDPMSRQAVLTIWQPRPVPSKDIPCTVAVSFQLRAGKVNVHVFMRSSDVWLGLPYDTFNLCMLGWLVAGNLGAQPGTLFLTMASSHLYAEHYGLAEACTKELEFIGPTDPVPVPMDLLAPNTLFEVLAKLKDSTKGDPLRWWEGGLDAHN